MPLAPSSLWAVVPVKEIWRSKQRLSDVLFADERERLVRAMLQDVLQVLVRVPLGDVVVVTRDGGLGDFAREWGVEIVAEDFEASGEGEGEGDLNAALGVAAKHLVRTGAGGMLVVPGDVPAVSTQEIEALIEAHAEAPAVTVVPDRRRGGTNALAMSPPGLVPFLFGESSFERHVAAARDAGVEPRVLELPGLQLDVDVESDLDDLALSSLGEATADLLRSLGRIIPPAHQLAATKESA
ncbi:MAG: 2-phospho-L-lactate guanylyltransferase [Acidobacteriota bacterium]|nr:2-phospho-L-lactate guanylyltransferase [Acidobacteriota bacterium]